MRQYQVKKLSRPISYVAEIPGSKSITNRALLLASMADGKSILRNVLFSDDSRSFLDCLEKLGYQLQVDEENKIVVIEGGTPCSQSAINVRSAGTTARFLTALLALTPGEYEVSASEQMCRRPMKPLCDTLEQLGVQIEYKNQKGFLPFCIKGEYRQGGEVELFAEQSSQFLSALLMTGHLCKEGLTIHHVGKEIAQPYIYITIKMIQQFGGSVMTENQIYTVKPSNRYRALDYMIEPDVSGACYFFAMAVLTGGEVLVRNVHLDSMQGDIEFLDILQQLGAEVTDTEEGVKVQGPEQGVYNGIDVDLNRCSDQTMTLAALAIFAKTPTTIRNISHIRGQESDRIRAITTELQKLGIQCRETEDGMVIYPGEPQPAVIDTYQDHRMAMAFSLVGLRADGIVIDNPECAAKTFENYFDLLDEITS